MISGRQIHEARNLLGWYRTVLATRAALTVTVIDRAKADAHEPPITVAQASAIRRVLETAGIEFTDDAGVRLRKRDAL